MAAPPSAEGTPGRPASTPTVHTRISAPDEGSRSTLIARDAATRPLQRSGGQVEHAFTAQRWGDFELQEELGRGGMGAVYRARQVSLDRTVALKVMLKAADPELRQRFQREAKALAQLDSPHVVKVFSTGEHQGQPYFVMEFLVGQDLARLLKDQWKPTVEEATRLMLQAARGLAAANRRGIIHRDIKPANLHITQDGVLKLMDFGLVRLSEEQELTHTGTVMGTVQYFSPEQGRGERCDHRSDLYSLGVVYFQLLAGRLPFVAENTASLIYQHVHVPAPPIRRFVPTLSPAIEQIVMRLLEKEPANRYADAQQVVQALEQALAGQTPSSPRPRAAARWRWAGVGVLVLGLALIIAAQAFSPRRGGTASPLRVSPASAAAPSTAPGGPGPGARGPAAGTLPPGGGSPTEPPAATAARSPAATSTPGAPRPPAAAIDPIPAFSPGTAVEDPAGADQQAPHLAAPDDGLAASAYHPPIPPHPAPPAHLAGHPVPPSPPSPPMATAHLAPRPTPPPSAPAPGHPGDPVAAPGLVPVADHWGWHAQLHLGGLPILLRWIPPGTFRMGSPSYEEGRHDDEVPHPVTISHGFWLAENPVSQALWSAVMGDNPSRPVGAALPVNRVTDHAAGEFLARVTRATHVPARLPWEAEWEYAARAGTETPYPWDTLTAEEACFDADEPRPVGQGTPNAWGLRDMVGNICQWCADDEVDYPAGAVTDPHPRLGQRTKRGTARGGCWTDSPGELRVARRFHPWTNDTGSPSIGLRFAVDGPQR